MVVNNQIKLRVLAGIIFSFFISTSALYSASSPTPTPTPTPTPSSAGVEVRLIYLDRVTSANGIKIDAGKYLDQSSNMTFYSEGNDRPYISKGRLVFSDDYPIACVKSPCPIKSEIAVDFGHCNLNSMPISGGTLYSVSGFPVHVTQNFDEYDQNYSTNISMVNFSLTVPNNETDATGMFSFTIPGQHGRSSVTYHGYIRGPQSKIFGPRPMAAPVPTPH